MISGLVQISICPYCGAPGIKDEGCDHVICYNCKNDFCYSCSCKRGPILAHGNHYHRVGCKHYAQFENDEFKKDCAECIKAGEVCKRPTSLIEGRIPPEL